MKKIVLIILSFLFIVGCNKNIAGPQILTSVSISPNNVSVVIGGTLQFTATAKDQGGNQMSATFVWTSSNNAVATIDSNGLLTAVSAGVITISVAAGGSVTNSTSVTVTTATPVLTSFTITPLNTSVAVGGTVQYVGYPKDQYGNNFNTTVSWASSNITVGTISQTGGLFSGVSAGISTITGTAGGTVSATTNVTVTSSSLHNYQLFVTGTTDSSIDICVGKRLKVETKTWVRTTYSIDSAHSYIWSSDVVQIDEVTEKFHMEGVCAAQATSLVIYRDGVSVSTGNTPAGVVFFWNSIN